jgi:phosphate transport system protein
MAINRAIIALAERRPELPNEVVQGDLVIDRREIAVESECLKLLALHQPVAADLRFIITVLKVNNDLERMGDLAKNIAERAAYLCQHDPIGVPLDFHRMFSKVRDMVGRSLDALVKRDTALARSVIDMDDEVDELNREMFMALQPAMREDPEIIVRAVHTLSASRDLERIADLATNIAEDVVFMIDGDVIRHQQKLTAGY